MVGVEQHTFLNDVLIGKEKHACYSSVQSLAKRDGSPAFPVWDRLGLQECMIELIYRFLRGEIEIR
jgi:hypothetical protein